MRKAAAAALVCCVWAAFAACGGQDRADDTVPTAASAGQTEEAIIREEASDMNMRIGETPVTVAWEDNPSVQALRELCADGPLTIELHKYGGFEQVGDIGADLPRDDTQITTQAGDIVLYSGDQLVVFYGSNSWAYTRLGCITDRDGDGMGALLGGGDVTVTLTAG